MATLTPGSCRLTSGDSEFSVEWGYHVYPVLAGIPVTHISLTTFFYKWDPQLGSDDTDLVFFLSVSWKAETGGWQVQGQCGQLI